MEEDRNKESGTEKKIGFEVTTKIICEWIKKTERGRYINIYIYIIYIYIYIYREREREIER